MVGRTFWTATTCWCIPSQNATNGESVVALIGDEATVKRFYRTERSHAEAENPLDPIEIEGSADGNPADDLPFGQQVMGVLRVMNK